jgi:radical SAM superfamily enzyme YgiQ (UPF0313 family)
MKRASILLVNPWIADFAAYDLWSKPVGLLYIAKFLQKYGHKIQLLDFMDRLRWNPVGSLTSTSGRGKYQKTIIPKPAVLDHVTRRYGLYGATKEQIISALQNLPPPDVILVTSLVIFWYPGVQQAVAILREIFPKAKIILGGIYATLFPEHARQTIQPDYLIEGYGEKQTLMTVEGLVEIQRDYSQIPPIDDAGQLPLELYSRVITAPILTSRGCPMHCDYCATPLLNPHFTQRESEDVVNEIFYYYHQLGIRQFAFYDDALLINKQRHIIPILEGLIESGIAAEFHTPIGLHAREIDVQLANLMWRSGFKTIRVSLESTSPKWQKASSLKVSNGQFEQALSNLERAGYKRSEIEVYLMMGLPGQTYQEVETAIRYVAGQGAITRLASFSPIPHTRTWQEAYAKGYVGNGMDPLLTNNTVYPCAGTETAVSQFYELRNLANQKNQKIRTVIHQEETTWER